MSQNEYLALPEDPSRMTYRRRYEHVDYHLLIELIGLDNLTWNTRLSVLDIGCGIFDFGSPTMHDLWAILRDRNIREEAICMVGVDPSIPENLQPAHPIQYVSALEEVSESEKFDIVRILRVVEHVSALEYSGMRYHAILRLREGGLFVSTQQLGRWHTDSAGPDLWGLDPIVKIMQKRKSALVTVALLPDALVPWPKDLPSLDRERELRDYAAYRTAVQEEEIALERQIDYSGFLRSMGWIRHYAHGVLSHESLSRLADEGLIGKARDGERKFDYTRIKRAAADAPKWFAKNLRTVREEERRRGHQSIP